MTLTPMLHARAAQTRQRLIDPGLLAGFDPAEPRDPDGKWSRVGALIATLKKAGTSEHLTFDDGDNVDWSTRKPDGGREFEFAAGHDAAVLSLTPGEMGDLHDELTSTLKRDTDGGIGLGDDSSLDWSPQDEEGNRWDLSVTDADGNQVTYDWPRSRMEHFHHALTGTLLAEAMGQHTGPSARARRRPANFDPEQPRVPGGHEGGGEWSGGSVLKDILKLAGRIELEPGEELLGSNKVNADQGTVRLALTELHGHRSLRLGIGGAGFGARDDEAGPWRGGPDTTEAANDERDRLSNERDRIAAELDRIDADPHADPEHKAALEARHAELADMDLNEVHASGYTAQLDHPAMEHLRSTLADALDKGATAQAADDARWNEIERLDAEFQRLDAMGEWTDKQEARWDELKTQIAELKAANPGYQVFAEGSVPGEWADVHWRVELDDPTVGVQVRLAALPPGLSAVGADADELIGNDQGAILDPAEARKLLRLLGQYAGTTQPSAHTGRRVTAARLRPTSLFTSAGRSRRLLNRADVKPRPTRADGQRWYRITNTAAGPTEVMIYDEIGLFGVSAAALVSDLKAITGDQIALHINSPGGEVFDGIAIYNALKAHRAAVTVHIDGLAASAASFIAQAGDRVLISRNAQMMIHDGLAVCVGNAADMQETAKLLDRCSDNIADIYAQRAGGTVADWRARMRAETWYTAQEAVDAGLADEVAQQPARDGDATLVVASWDLSVFRYPGRTAAPGPRNAAPAGAMGCDTCDTAASDDQVPDDHYEQMLTDLLVDLDDDQVRELAELAEAMVAANPDATTGPAARASAPVNEHIGFNALKARLAAKGAHNPGGLAAYIGRKKYGRAGMAAKAAAGRAAHKATDHTGPVPLFEFNPDDFRTAVAAIRPAEPVFDPDLFRAAVQVVATDAPAVPDPTPPAPPEDPPITIDPAAFRRALREGRL